MLNVNRALLVWLRRNDIDPAGLRIEVHFPSRLRRDIAGMTLAANVDALQPVAGITPGVVTEGEIYGIPFEFVADNP
jgi:hypothetical protein